MALSDGVIRWFIPPIPTRRACTLQFAASSHEGKLTQAYLHLAQLRAPHIV
jgi:hypothetical protein